jgi:serine/threonine protein kinase
VSEVSILKRIDHIRIIKYIEAFFSSDGRKLCIVMEFANLQTLENVVRDNGCRKEEYCVWRFLLQGSKSLNSISADMFLDKFSVSNFEPISTQKQHTHMILS